MISHVKTHKSLDLALSDSSSRQSQTLPALVSSSLLVPRPQSVQATASVPAAVMQAESLGQPLQSTVIDVVHVDASATSLGSLLPRVTVIQGVDVTLTDTTITAAAPGKPADTTLTCDLCSTILKSKAALTKHRVL